MSRYHKKIIPDADGLIDLYAIAEAFGVKSNPQFHAFKKTIMAGQRGDKGVRQDIDEAIQALQRWKEMVTQECVTPTQFNAPPLCSACHTLHHVGAPCSARALLDQLQAPPIFFADALSQHSASKIPQPVRCPTCGHAGRECMCKKNCTCGCLGCSQCYPDAT